MNRRHFCAASGLGLGALLAGRFFSGNVARAEEPKRRAEACIVLWLNGGPSHLDTFDPKPGSKNAGKFRAIKTATEGLLFSEHLPKLASLSQKFSVVHSLTTREGSHERARKLLHTGHTPNPTVAHPAFGSWVSARRGGKSPELPAFVSLGGPSADAGFLGRGYGPLVVREPGKLPDDLAILGGMSPERLGRRLSARQKLDAVFEAETKSHAVVERGDVFAAAARLVNSPSASAFDISSEPQTSRDAYGDNEFGRGCLAARRLIEKGVRFAEVTLDGWDTHENNFERIQALSGKLDAAMGALLTDLSTRGLLDKTLVVCMGEFGRSPAINNRDGRDHHPEAFSMLIGGGGLRAGTVLGATDGDGAKVVTRPVRVADVFATLSTQLGMDPHETLMTPEGRPIAVTDGGQVIGELLS